MGPLQYENDALRIYGSLSREQRIQLRNGEHVPVLALSPAAQENLAMTLYWIAQDMDAIGSTRGEPTETFPNGLPPSGYLAVKKDVRLTYSEPIKLVRGEEIVSGYTQNVESFGRSLGRAAASGGGTVASAAATKAYHAVRIFPAHNFVFDVHYSESLSDPMALTEIFHADAKILDFSALPPEFAKAFAAGKAAVEKQKKEQQSAPGASPPPP
jgi:hypothetical protein